MTGHGSADPATRRSALRRIGLAALALAAPVQLAAAQALLAGHPLAGTIWDLQAAARSSVEALKRALRNARFRLLGEVHDNPGQHAIQLELLASLGEAGLAPAVAFEQFDREHGEALRQRQRAGGGSAEDLAVAGQMNRKGWAWDFYRPLVETALRHGMPVRAANLSRAAAGRVAKEGFAALGEGRAAALRLEAVWSPDKDRALRELIFEGHCRALPERMMPGMAAAQRARDATMAEALLDVTPDGAVLIAGNGHVRRDLAVPLYLARAAPGAGSVSLGLLEVEAGKSRPGDYLPQGGEAAYDFVWFTARTPREDPCKAFAAK